MVNCWPLSFPYSYNFFLMLLVALQKSSFTTTSDSFSFFLEFKMLFLHLDEENFTIIGRHLPGMNLPNLWARDIRSSLVVKFKFNTEFRTAQTFSCGCAHVSEELSARQ